MARYSGPATRLYLNVFTEDRQASFRYSVCGDCLAELMTEWLGKALHQTDAGYWDPPTEDETLESLLSGPRASRNGFRARN